MNLEKEVFEISLNDIIPNRFQPREIFEDEALQELAESIKKHGVIQPIIVRKIGDKYEIIAGERRYRASKAAGKETIPALVRDIDDKEAAKIALLENLQRSNLTAIEEAKTYQTILKIENITQEELAANLGKSQSTIANKLRLLSLTEEVQTALLNSQISERHARSLLGLDRAKQIELLNRTLNEKLTVRQLDEEVLKLTGKMPNVSNAEATIEEKQEQPEDFVQNKILNQSENTIEQPEIQNNINNIPKININQEQPQEEQNNQEIPSPVAQESIQNNIPDINPINQANQIPTPQPEPIQNNDVEVPVTQESIQEMNIPKINIDEPRPNIPQGQENIFDKLRVKREEPQEEENNQENLNPVTNETIINNPNNIYDLRFAINNFRQAIQNTEKFGFRVVSNENETEDKYQIVIEIDKK